MEVTQFTYFQQMGGFDMKPVAGELTYGLERLAMYIQDKDSVYDLAYNDAPNGRGGVTYGDVFLENEREMSKWNFEVADTETPLRPVPQERRGMRELPRQRLANPRLRTGDQGEPHLQPPADARRHLRRRTPGLHGPRPRPGEKAPAAHG